MHVFDWIHTIFCVLYTCKSAGLVYAMRVRCGGGNDAECGVCVLSTDRRASLYVIYTQEQANNSILTQSHLLDPLKREGKASCRYFNAT